MIRMNRRGVVAVESAVVLSVVLLLLFGLIDLSIAVLRRNAIEYSTNKIARSYAISAGLSSDDAALSLSTNAGSQELSHLIANGLPTIPRGQMLVAISESVSAGDVQRTVAIDIQFAHQAIVPALLPWNQLQMRSHATHLVIPADSAR